MLTRQQVLDALRARSGVPFKGKQTSRHIYEIAGPQGHFHIDYAAFPGGATDEVPRKVIDELEAEGIIERAYPQAPHINGWKLVE
jgi:hypothetical protein